MSLRKIAIRLIILFGIVSLFADMTYEGGRSITGPFLSILGASGTAVGIIVGIGEFFGYAFRGLSGYLTDRTKKYWLFTIIGYAINLFVVPLLAFASNWKIAGVLIVLERIGKAVRVPARDAMLSFATKHTGRGWGFGLHEALDQIGAVIGPLIIATLLIFRESYRLGFAILVVPAFFAMIVLFITRRAFPRPHELEPLAVSLKAKGLSKTYWIYLLAVGLVAAGYVDFALIAFHFKTLNVIAPFWIPFLYAIAMAVEGLAGLTLGRIFDVHGILALAIVTAVTSLFAPLVFFGSFAGTVIGMILWGIGLGSQETIMRAIIAHLVGPHKRAVAYGLLNTFFGVFWSVGSVIMGVLYDISFLYLVLFSVVVQLLAVPLFLIIKLRKS